MFRNVWRDGRFLLYFSLLYIANLAVIGASSIFFLSSVSLELLKANNIFIGFIIGLPRYAVILFSILAFKYAGKIDKRTTIIWGSILGVLAFAGLSLSKGYVPLVLFCLLYGWVYMVAMNYVVVMLLDHTPVKQRASVLGFFTTSSSLGTFFGPYLAHSILDWVLLQVGPHAEFPVLNMFGMFSPMDSIHNPNFMFFSGVIYYIIAGSFLSLSLLVSKKLPLAEGAATDVEPSTNPTNKKKSNVFSELWFEYSDMAYIGIFLGAMWVVLLTLVPSFDHVIGLGKSGLFFLGFSIVGFFGRIFLASQLGRWKVGLVVGWGLCIYVCCFFLMILFGSSPSGWLLLLVGSLQGLAHGTLYPSTNILFTHKVPHQTSRSTLAFVVMFHVGTFFNIPVGGLVDAFGHMTTFIIASIIVTISAVLLLRRKSMQEFFHSVDVTMRRG